MVNVNFLFEDSSYKGVAVLLGKDFMIKRANQRFLKLNGYNEEEILRIKFIDMIVPREKSRFLDVLYHNIITQDITVQLYHKTGAFRFYSLIVLTFENQFLVLGNEIKKEFTSYDYLPLAKELATVDALFKDLDVKDVKELFEVDNPALNFVLDVLPIDVWVKDRYAKYVYCNETFTKHTKHSREDVKNKSDFELFEKSVANEFVVSDNNVINSGQKLNYIFESKSKTLLTWTDVTKIPLFNKNGVYIGIIGFSIDITDTKRIELKYQEEVERTRNLLDNISGLIFEIDPKGKVLFMAGGLKNSFDLNHDYAALEFIDSKQRPELKEKVRFALSGNEVKIRTHVKDVFVEFVLTPVPNKEGSFNLIGVGTIIKEDEDE